MLKILFFPPKSGHVVKFITFTDLLGKFKAVLPLASSQSPSSGDHYLLMRFEDVQRSNNLQETYVRTLLSGNDEHFVIVIVDSGFVHDQHNKPREVHNIPTLPDICHGCVAPHQHQA